MRYKKFLRWFYQITDEIKHHLQKSFTLLPVLRYSHSLISCIYKSKSFTWHLNNLVTFQEHIDMYYICTKCENVKSSIEFWSSLSIWFANFAVVITSFLSTKHFTSVFDSTYWAKGVSFGSHLGKVAFLCFS